MVQYFISKQEGLFFLKRLGYLFSSILAIWFFMFYLAPGLEKLINLTPIAECIDERGIDANMYFYTEVDEFSEAAFYMENTMKYSSPQLNK
ncbi:MAG: hypothetical protein JRI61_07270 [Deltaproteobacteria bacterium]|nr:hypothetical protein [Deltaproteobacteria bacterium]